MSKDMLKEVGGGRTGEHDEEILKFLRYVLGTYITQPDELVAELMYRGASLEFHLWPDKADYGKIWGSKGYMLRALVTIVSTYGKKLGETVDIILERDHEDPFKPHSHVYTKPIYDESWNKEQLRTAIEKILTTCGMDNLTVLVKSHVVKTSSFFTVKGWREDQKDFAAAFVVILRAIAKKQGHDLIHDVYLTEDTK